MLLYILSAQESPPATPPPPTVNQTVQNVNSIEVEKPWSKRNDRSLNRWLLEGVMADLFPAVLKKPLLSKCLILSTCFTIITETNT